VYHFVGIGGAEFFGGVPTPGNGDGAGAGFLSFDHVSEGVADVIIVSVGEPSDLVLDFFDLAGFFIGAEDFGYCGDLVGGEVVFDYGGEV